jgi:hypothetical protein
VKLTPEDIEALTADPAKQELPMPSLAELDHALKLLRKRYPVDTWYLRRRLKWLCRKMDRHYDVKWTVPWGRKN